MRYGKISTIIALAVVACTSGDTIVGTPSFDALDESLPAGVHGHFSIGPYAGGRQTVHVVLQAREVDFSSYQGMVEFDQGVFRLVSVSEPRTDTHFFNQSEAANGHLPIAGFATDGFDEPIAITLSFSTPRALRTGDIYLKLDVVGTSIGTEVPPALIYLRRKLVQGSGG